VTDVDLDPSDRESIRVFAGDCTMEFTGGRDCTRRGRVVILVKPDRTVLVHDATGFQPVAWLTRADSLTVETAARGGSSDGPERRGDGQDDPADGRRDDARDEHVPDPPSGGVGIVARSGDERLRVVSHGPATRARYPASAAGVPVGECADCGGTLVRNGGVACLDCSVEHALPAGATVLECRCDDCGAPLMRVERGTAFVCCVDVGCRALGDLVADRFDRSFDCPACGRDLRVERARGRTFLGCEGHPDCDARFSVPAGEFVDECDCGLPIVETATGRRCLDTDCDRDDGR
jgi:DNA topoisomerase-1